MIQVFPNFLNMVALFLILQQFGNYIPALGLNTYGGLLLIYLGGTLGANTWLTKGYFDSIPRDLDEAATVDGASPWQTFSQILLPLVRPIIVVVALLTFIGTYSEYVLARVMFTDKYMYTMAVGLNDGCQPVCPELGRLLRRSVAGSAADHPAVHVLPTLSRWWLDGRFGQGLVVL